MTHILKLLFSVILCVVALSFSEPSEAQEVEVVTEYLAPFQIRNEDGSLGGFATDIVNRLFDITNDSPNVNVLPWARAYRIALSRPNTLIYSIAKTSQRSNKFTWVGKVKSERFFVWGLRDNFTQPLGSIEDTKGYTLAISKSYNSAIYAENNGFRNIHYTTRDRQSIGMLFKKRVEIIISSEQVIKQVIMSHGYDFSKLIKLADVPALNNELSIAFSKGSEADLIRRFRLAYIYLDDSGELQRLREKWQVFDDQSLVLSAKVLRESE